MIASMLKIRSLLPLLLLLLLMISNVECDASPPFTFATSVSSLDGRLVSVAAMTGRTVALSEKRTIYESTDNERTFVPMASTAGWQATALQVLPSNAKRAIMYLQSDSKTGFMPYATTVDAGASWRLYNDSRRVPTALRYFAMHETRDNMLMSTQFVTKPCTLSCDDRTVGLHPNALVSVDFGETWSLLGEYAIALSFGRDDSLLLLDDPQKQGVWADCANFASCRLLRVPFRRTPATDTANATTEVLADEATLVGVDVTAVTRAGSVLFSSHRDRWTNNTFLRVATDGTGESWHDCLFPDIDVHTNRSANDVWRNFAVLGAADSTLLVAVQNADAAVSGPSGTLFAADILAPHLFRRVMSRLVMSQASRLSAALEASVMAGVNGTVFANQFQNDNLTCSRTMVSFDYGASWRETVPLVNGGVYAMAIGPGVGMAFSANVKCLDAPIPGNLTLVLTLDAGRTWREIHQSSSFTYELAARGAILALAQAALGEDQVTVSGDFGATWTVLNFSTPAIPDGIAIENIISTDYTRDSLLLYGIGANQTGVLVSIAPASAVPACTADQYEVWSDATNCTLGAKTTMLRRKASVACLADSRVEFADIVPCACTATDAACDVCACDGASNATCTRWRNRVAIAACEGRGNDSFFLPPSASRRLPGNVCVGSELDGHTEACPPLPPPTVRPTARPAPWDTTSAPESEPVSGGTIAGVVIGLVAVVIVAASVILYIFRRRFIRSRLPQLRRRLLGGKRKSKSKQGVDDNDKRVSNDRGGGGGDNGVDDNDDDHDDDDDDDVDSDQELLS